MNRRSTAFVFASVLALAALVGLAWAANVEEELKKLETDRAAAAVKGDVATLEKQTSDDYTFINLYGQMSDKSQMVDNFRTGRTKLTSNEVRARRKEEALFAELKNYIGLRRLRLRRMRFVREQFYLAATVQNLKRLVRFLSGKPTPQIATA